MDRNGKLIIFGELYKITDFRAPIYNDAPFLEQMDMLVNKKYKICLVVSYSEPFVQILCGNKIRYTQARYMELALTD